MKRLFAITAMMLVLVIIIVVSTLAPAAANAANLQYTSDTNTPSISGGGGGGISVGGGVIGPPQSLPVVFAKLDESFTLQKGQTAIVTDYKSMRVELKGVVSKSCAAVVGQECLGPEAVVAVSTGESAKASGASVSVGGGGGAAAGVSPAMPLSSTMPKLVKVLQLSAGESATAFDATITALDVSSDKAMFVVSKELYVSDVVDVGITPRSVNVEAGKTATYTVTVQDKHKAPECPPGAACSPRAPVHTYKIQVIGLSFETSYQKAVTVAAGEKTEMELTVDTSKKIGRLMPSQPTNEADRAETAAAPAAATGIATSATSAASAVKGTAVYIARKCAASSEDYNKCVAKEEKLDAETSAVSAVKAKAASSTAAVAAKYETYRFAVRVTGEGNAVDVAYATLNMLPKQPAAPPTPPTEEQPPIEVQPVEKVSISLLRGWNLVSLPGKVVTFLPSDCTKSRKLLGFIYMQNDGGAEGKYVSLQEARRQLGGEFADYLSKHAFWVYSYNGCTFDANVKRYVSYDELSLQPGWNLLPINVGVVGKNLNELNVNCDFTRLFTWDSSMQSWNRLTQDYVFSQEDVNKGFIAKTDNYCEFGGELTISPPELPD